MYLYFQYSVLENGLAQTCSCVHFLKYFYSSSLLCEKLAKKVAYVTRIRYR